MTSNIANITLTNYTKTKQKTMNKEWIDDSKFMKTLTEEGISEIPLSSTISDDVFDLLISYLEYRKGVVSKLPHPPIRTGRLDKLIEVDDWKFVSSIKSMELKRDLLFASDYLEINHLRDLLFCDISARLFSVRVCDYHTAFKNKICPLDFLWSEN